MAVPSATEFVEKHRPAGGRRSSKRDFIVSVFLRQEGHIGADHLVDLIRREDPRISRATVYRTLQWMEDAGIARRVDFGEGKFRFEHSYRHPRHFHLICKSCNQSFEFLSSDIESLVEDIAVARGFSPRQSVLQIYGMCQACTSGEAVATSPVPADALFARDALRIAVATERSGRDFYTRAARITRDARGRQVFERLRAEEEEHLGKLEQRYRELLAENPALESHPTFLFFKGAANGLFAAGTEELAKGVDDRQALLIGIRCERGSHKFFKKYGERFEESEGRRVFLEFADEEREHLELLLREYKDLVARQTAATARKKWIDLHLHTTASDGRSTPERLIERASSRGIRTCAVTDHDTVAGLERARAAGEQRGVRVVSGIEITAVVSGVDIHMLGYFFDPAHVELDAFLVAQREDRKRRVLEMLDRLDGLGLVLPRDPILAAARKTAGKAIGRPAIAQMLVAHGHVRDIADAFDRYLAAGRSAFVPRRGASPADVVQLIGRAGGVSSFAHPGKLGHDELIAPLASAGLTAVEVFHPDHDEAAVDKYRAMARSLGLAISGGSDYHGTTSGRTDALGRVTLPAEAFDELWRRAPRPTSGPAA